MNPIPDIYKNGHFKLLLLNRRLHISSRGLHLGLETCIYAKLTFMPSRFLPIPDKMVHANPTQTVALSERINLTLLSIIRDNIVSQYGSQAVLLAEFRDAVAKHGTTDVDATLADFRAHVPLSNYDSYKPLLDKFNVQPCKEENVINMFAPGLPDFLVVSSGTSGANPKIILKYNHSERLKIPARRYFDATDKDPLAAVLCTEYRDVKVIERAPGDVSRRIPVCIASGGLLRRTTGCYIDDESRMSFPCMFFPSNL